MITDNQTNFLYLADSLLKKYPVFYNSLEKILRQNNVAFELLPGTKDIWAVDYMPVQVSHGQYIQFKYTPDYLKPSKYQRTISDSGGICKAINITPEISNIVLDGGNVIRSDRSVIMCDKVFRENPHIAEIQLINELTSLFSVDKLFFVPQDINDFTGHADGMVRFVDANTVLINDLSHEPLTFQSAFRMSLHNAGLAYIEIPYCPDPHAIDSAKGLYLNYLQMQNIIVLPVFGIKEDEKAVMQFEKIFKGVPIIPIDCNEIATQGGLMNCISWNIKRD